MHGVEDLIMVLLGMGLLAVLLAFPLTTLILLFSIRKQLRALKEKTDRFARAWPKREARHAEQPTAAASADAQAAPAKVAEPASESGESRPASSSEADPGILRAGADYSGPAIGRSVAAPSRSVVPPPLPASSPPSFPFAADKTDSRPPEPMPKSERDPASGSASEPPLRERGPFQEKAGRVLRGIWNWLIVGEEYRRPGVSLEFAVASNWLLRAGVVATVFGIVFFLRLAVERGLLQPQVRVALSLLTGACMIAGGIRLLGRKYHLLAQGLMGAGVATLYASVFAAANLFHLVPMGTAFAMMAAVTVAAGIMSVRFDSLLMALLGLLGGYGTPLLLSIGSATIPGLFSYMLFLGAGVLGVAFRKEWRLLVFLAFLATTGLAKTALESAYEPAMFWQVMPFLAAYFALFSTTTFVYQTRRRQPTTALDLFLLVLNAAAFFWLGYGLMADSGLRAQAALLTLALAAFHTAHAYGFLRRPFRDRGLILSFLALAAFFAAVTVPIHFSRAWHTASWSLQALLMLWLADKMRSRFLRQIAYALYGIVFVRFLFFDLHVSFATAWQAGAAAPAYARLLLERLAQFGVPIACMAGAFRLLRRPALPGALRLDEANDIPAGLEPAGIAPVAFAFLFLMTFVYAHLELSRGMAALLVPDRPALTLLWVAGWAVLLAWRDLCPRPLRLILMTGLAVGLAGQWLFSGLPGWGLSWYAGRYARLDGRLFALRALDWACVIAFCLYAFRLLRRDRGRPAAGRAFGYAALALLFLYTSLELNTAMHFAAPGMRSGALSAYWGLYALALVLGGIVKRTRPLRLAGLALFAIVVARVFLLDLNRLDAAYRIGAFLAVGLVLIAGSFVYLKFSESFAGSDGNGKESA